MENENIQESLEQVQPSNLEDALKLLRNKDKTPATENVENTGSNETGAEPQEHGSELGELSSGATAKNDIDEEQRTSISIEGSGELGGSADTTVEAAGEPEVGYESDEYQEIQNRIIESVRRQAAMAANEKFRQEGIEKVTLTQLYQRDEESGRVTFHNPDDPDRPFENRAQAQAWVDSYNSQIDAEWVNYANQMQQQFAQQTLPAMRLMAFAPTYDAMDARTQKYFDALIRNFGVTDSTGALIGYSCDLNAAYAQARELAAIDGGTTETTVANAAGETIAKAPSGPALDATTSGSDTSGSKMDTPKNLNDAMKMINKMKRGKK